MNAFFRKSRKFVLPMLLCSCVPLAVHAQRFGRLEQTQSNLDTYHYHVEPGAATIQVTVMGPVRYPGIYELTKGTDLKQVLALCGGPDPGRVEFINKQRTTIRLYRQSHDARKPLHESLIEETITAATSPELAEGDVVVVDVAAWRRFDWRDILTIVSVANTLVLIVLAFENQGD